MFDIVKDVYNTYDDELKKVKLKDLSAIYLKINSNEQILFERFNDFWTFETKDGKFDYKINNESTFEELINQLKNNYQFDDNFTVRVFSYLRKNDKSIPEFTKLIIPNRRKNINQELFGDFELRRMFEVHCDLYKDEPEKLEDFKVQMDVVGQDVMQIVSLISAQAHTSETLNFTMNLVSSILASYPLTPITDEEKYKDDWVDINTINSKETNEYITKLLELDDMTIESIFINMRCTRIIKVNYKNNKNEIVTEYYDIAASIFIDDEEKVAYHGEQSITSITLPWMFVQTNEVMLDDEMKKNKDKMKKFLDIKI